MLTETSFTATATTHFVSFTESSGSSAFVKLVEFSENLTPIPLKYLSFEEYTERFRERDSKADVDKFGDPEYVYTTYNDEIGLTLIPDTSNLTLEFGLLCNKHRFVCGNRHEYHTHYLFEPVIVSRAKYYTYMFRSDTQTAQFALKEYEDSLKRMRVELLNRKDYMRAV